MVVCGISCLIVVVTGGKYVFVGLVGFKGTTEGGSGSKVTGCTAPVPLKRKW